MNTFAGTWRDSSGTTMTINATNNILSVKYSNGRGPFPGFELDLYSSVISVDFTDDKPFTGVLVNASTIAWSNGSSWTRA